MDILYLIWDTNLLRGTEDGEVRDGAGVSYLHQSNSRALRYLAKYVKPAIIFGGNFLKEGKSPKWYKFCV
jgi:hypothetical protein